MSSKNAGENPAGRKSKDSYATLIGVGLVGPKAYPKGEVDGQLVNIPAPLNNCLNQRGDANRYAEHTYWTSCVFDRRRVEKVKIFSTFDLRRKKTMRLASWNSADSKSPRKTSLIDFLKTVPQTNTGRQG